MLARPRSLDAGRRKRRDMSDLVGLWSRFRGKLAPGFLVVAAVAWGWFAIQSGSVRAAGGPAESNGEYRVLAPIESGNLLLFPVVRANGKQGGGTPFLTLDEGFKNGSVEVTEAGNVRGLVRRRDNGPVIVGGDQV